MICCDYTGQDCNAVHVMHQGFGRQQGIAGYSDKIMSRPLNELLYTIIDKNTN
jgi:hypothetical protein